MIELRDQLNREVKLPHAPRRIVSLVPSITELLFDLGLEDRICGRTSFCVEPKEQVENIEMVGGTKTADAERIRSLNPDLIIANKEENTPELIEALERDFPVYISDVLTIEDALEMITHVGLLTDRKERAGEMCRKIDKSLGKLGEINPGDKKRVLYLIWSNPIMVAGSDTFIHSMLEKSGFENLGAQLGARYPKCEIEALKSLSPDMLILSSEPYRFTEKHLREWQDLIPLATVILADATYFSWYGSRLLHSAEYISANISS